MNAGRKAWRVVVFGRKGCDKCALLNKRLDDLLATPEYADFEKSYHDILTLEGLVALCEGETLNPQRIPSFQIHQLDPATGEYRRIPWLWPPTSDADPLEIPGFLGLETDYSATGTLVPSAIKSVLDLARSMA